MPLTTVPASGNFRAKSVSSTGGSAANTVYGIAQLGGSAALCGKVAGDAFGKFYVANMQQSGVVFVTASQLKSSRICTSQPE